MGYKDSRVNAVKWALEVFEVQGEGVVTMVTPGRKVTRVNLVHQGLKVKVGHKEQKAHVVSLVYQVHLAQMGRTVLWVHRENEDSLPKQENLDHQENPELLDRVEHLVN